MEHLSKQQLILLALLVSFVTSIATGIVTVSLVNQAPQAVTQTINRVVERTIEKVVPSEPAKNTQTIIKETVVVKADDMVVDSIEKNSGSIFRIYRTNSDVSADSSSMVFVGLGFVVSNGEILATDRTVISTNGNYFVNLSDNKLHSLNILRAKDGEQIALLNVLGEDKKPIKIASATKVSTSDIKLGQTVVYIGGEFKNLISTGIVSSLGTKEINTEIASSTASSTEIQKNTIILSIETNISKSDFLAGAPLINLSGEIVGMKVVFMDSARTDLFVPAKAITDVLNALTSEQKKP